MPSFIEKPIFGMVTCTATWASLADNVFDGGEDRVGIRRISSFERPRIRHRAERAAEPFDGFLERAEQFLVDHRGDFGAGAMLLDRFMTTITRPVLRADASTVS